MVARVVRLSVEQRAIGAQKEKTMTEKTNQEACRCQTSTCGCAGNPGRCTCVEICECKGGCTCTKGCDCSKAK